MMLLCEDFQWRQKGRLSTKKLMGVVGCYRSDNGLSTSDVSLHQAEHGFFVMEILDDFFSDTLLCTCEFKRYLLQKCLDMRPIGFLCDTSYGTSFMIVLLVEQSVELDTQETVKKHSPLRALQIGT